MRRSILIIFVLLFGLSLNAKNKYSYYYQRAEEYYQQEDYDQALAYLQQGVQTNKKDGYCWAVIAEIYSKYAYARYAEALDASTEALRYLSKDRWWTGFVYGVRGDIYYKIGNYPASREAYERSLQYNADNSDISSSLADTYRALGEYDKSIAQYKAILQKDPAQPYIYADMAKSCILAGRYDEARQACRMSLALYGEGNNRAYAYLGNLALAKDSNVIEACHWAMEAAFKGKWNDVTTNLLDTLVQINFPMIELAALQRLESQPNDADHLALLYYLYRVKGMPVEKAYYTQQIINQGEDKGYIFDLAQAYEQLGMFDEAVNNFQKVLENDSTTANTINYVIARAALRHGRYDMALAYIDKTFTDGIEDAQDLRLKAKIYRNMERHEDAIRILEKALALSKEEERRVYYLNLGEENIWAGHAEEGRNYLEMCLELGAPKRMNNITLALAAASLGKIDEAHRYMRDIVANPQPSDYIDLAMVYALTGEKEAALRNIRLDAEHTGNYLGNDLMHEYRYKPLWNDPDFQALANEQEQHLKAERARLQQLFKPQDEEAGVTEIPFTIVGGVNQVRCLINNLPLYFVFDTGASDVTISSVEANFMLKNGYLNEADFMGKQNFVTATGEIHEGTIINLREVRVGDITLTNIKASVVNSQSAPLLLGQSVFRRFGTLEVDNRQHVIRMKR